MKYLMGYGVVLLMVFTMITACYGLVKSSYSFKQGLTQHLLGK